MDTKRRKELVNEWKKRCPEMGVISVKCKATEESFLGISMDTKADFNSTRFKLQLGGHPNKHMQELWNRYGEDGFEFSVLKELKCDDPQKDYTEQLLALRDECMAGDPHALLIWK